MAIAKWIPFGTTPSIPAPPEDAKPPPIALGCSSADGKQFGLENFGNTCYANSVLQALYFCSPFRELVLQSSDPSIHQQDVPIATPTTPSSSPSTSSPTARKKLDRKLSIAGHSPDASPVTGIAQPTGPPIPLHPPTLFSALRSLFLHISRNKADKGTVAPRAFIDKLKELNELFRSTMHQDAHEFLNYLLNRIVEEIEDERKRQHADIHIVEDLSNSTGTLSSRSPAMTTISTSSGTPPQDATLVHRLFEGILTSETRCLTCETVSSRDESFLDLSIDIEQNSSVTACLRQFSASEMLCQKNKFFCDSCCDLQEAEKRMKIKKLPNVLALHLKRFKYQEDVQKYIKLAYRVAFPYELRLFNTVDDAQDADRLYELFAIVVHIGNGPHHGHYVSIIKTLGSWFVFDDDTVDSIKENEIPKYFGESNSGSAYVLYYQAVDIDLPALGIRDATPPPTEERLPESPTDPSNLMQRSVPVLPPGLVKGDDDSSDTSEPFLRATPSPPQQPPPLSSTEDSPRIASSQRLTVSVTSQEDTSSVATSADPSSPIASTGSANNDSKGGLWRVLRPAPSTKIRGDGGSATGFRRSTADKTGRPVTSPGIEPGEDQYQYAIPSVNDKETDKEEKIKEPARKPSGWFQRRSKADRSRPETAHDNSSSHLSSSATGDSGHSPSSTSSTWFRTAGHLPKQSGESNRRRASEAPFYEASVYGAVPSTRSKSQPFAEVHRVAAQGATNGRESGYPGPSSFASNSASASPSSVNFPKHSSLAPIPASPQGSRYLQSSDHKKSASHLGGNRQKERDAYTTSFIPPRPSTAGAATGRTLALEASAPPVPPLPAMPTSPSHRVPLGNGIPMSNGVLHGDGSTRRKTGGDAQPRRPSTAHGSVGLGLESMADGRDADAGIGGANSATSNFKRATRKLSLTAPLLGFGKKDRQKEKDTQPPPSSFHQFSSRIG